MKPKDGAKILIFSPDKVLLFHRDNKPGINAPDCWCLIGGGIDEGETPEQGLIREVKEEVCYDLKDHRFISKLVGSHDEDVYYYVLFVDKDDESKFVHGLSEGQGIGWFTLDEISSLKLSPGTDILFSKFKDLIVNLMTTRTIPDKLNINPHL